MAHVSSIVFGAVAPSSSFLGVVPVAQAATQVVSNCADTGAGSLRDAIAMAATGDTIDARNLRCGSIVLGRRIEVPQANLAVLGPGTTRLAIDANFADRLFLHAGRGVLRLNGMTLARGRELAQEALGGCIRSAGSVTLESVHMHYCQAEGQRPPGDDEPLGTSATAAGGGIYAAGNVRMVDSEIHDGSASTITGWGGGVAAGTLTLYRSRLRANTAQDGAGAYVFGFHATQALVDHNASARSGGVHVWGDAFVLRSTIADNTADYCGGICVQGHARIVDSTLSRNASGVASAGAFSGDVEIFNSTIADNRIYGGSPSGCPAVLARLDTPYRMHIESSIVAANRCTNGGAAMDIAIAPASEGRAADVVSGASNLIGNADGPLPADTLRSNPRISTLADNGGPTPTMRIASDSPALDRGANPLGLTNDQRGAGFPRTSGARTDIGAYERGGP